VRRDKIKEMKKIVDKVTVSGGYLGGGGGLGAITRLLHFEYKNMSVKVQRDLDNKLLHKYATLFGVGVIRGVYGALNA